MVGFGLDLGSQTVRAFDARGGRLAYVPGANFPAAIALVERLVLGREAGREGGSVHSNILRGLTAVSDACSSVLLTHPNGGMRTVSVDLGLGLLLGRLKQDCCARLVNSHALPTLPSACISLQVGVGAVARARIRNAALAAGWTSPRLLPSLACAAAAWANDTERHGETVEGPLLVVDAGARFTSCGIVSINRGESGRVEVALRDARARRTGGAEIDQRLGARTLPLQAAELTAGEALEMMERGKKEVAASGRSVVSFKGVRVVLATAEVTEAAAPLLGWLKDNCDALLAAAPQRPTRALLVGGLSRLPALSELVQRGLSGRPHGL
eukprot:Hpha_TRINITY_DN20693_c0_g1::TRINITY_DN20693_c0_g1_i1::g.148156::m.148156